VLLDERLDLAERNPPVLERLKLSIACA
jgi:hypothetical protein